MKLHYYQTGKVMKSEKEIRATMKKAAFFIGKIENKTEKAVNFFIKNINTNVWVPKDVIFAYGKRDDSDLDGLYIHRWFVNKNPDLKRSYYM